jgi:hypothetical protein
MAVSRAPFCLKARDRKEVLIWLKNLKFPDGYAVGFGSFINLDTEKLSGVNSHDYHIFIQRLIPVMFHGYMDSDVWMALAELSHFYRQLCDKEIRKDMVEKLEEEISVLLCKLEKIFPPEWFKPMQHLRVHLPYEAKTGGLQQYRWMYHIERALKKLRAMIHNKAKVEGCIAEEFKLKEITYFSSMYFAEHHNVNTPTLRYHVDEDISCSDLQIFQWTGVTVGASTTYQPTEEEQMSTLLYMYANMHEMDQYLRMSIFSSSLLYTWLFTSHVCMYSFNLTTCSIQNTYLLAGNQW